MQTDLRRFLIVWLISSLAVIALMGAINTTVDPYSLLDSPRLHGFNVRKNVLSKETVTKASQLSRVRSNALVLGPSTADMGMDAQSDAWPMDIRPVYNSALIGSGPYTSYRYLQHAVAHRSPKTIVLTLEYPFFLSIPISRRPTDAAFEARLSVTASGDLNPDAWIERVRDRIHSLFSLEALSDSLSTVAANQRRDSYALQASGSVHVGRDSFLASGLPGFAGNNMFYLQYYADRSREHDAMRAVGAILELCTERGIHAVVIVSPVHASMLEIIHMLGYGQDYDSWKRELVALVEKYSEGQASVVLWDFSGYDRYSVEEFSSNGEPLEWFYDSAHYTPALGDRIVLRVFGKGDVGFGTLLTPENIDSHLVSIREQREHFLASRPAEIQRLQRLRDELRSSVSQEK